MRSLPSWLAVASLLLLPACDPPPVIDEDASIPDDVGTTPDAPPAGCEDDADCDDDLFCSGAETCAPDDPDADADGCVAGDDPCLAGQACDEDGDLCETECGVADDADGDGSRATECGGDDCDDADPLAHPGASEVCDAMDRDEDCDPETYGLRDSDGDGHPDMRCCNGTACGTDCDDARSDVHPGLAETCDVADNDCDGASDEGVGRSFWPDADSDGHGDAAGTPITACFRPAMFAETDDDCDDTRSQVSPSAPEQCDGATPPLDENCDGEANPADYCSCSGDVSRACTLPGACMAGTQRCVLGSWGACSISPVSEVCNAIDDDCDGSIDDRDGGGLLTIACYADADDDGYAAAGTTEITSCPVSGRGAALGCPFGSTGRAPLGMAVDCAESDPRRTPGATETCDRADNDCDGMVDEGEVVTCFADPDDDGYAAVGAATSAECPASGRGDVGGCPFGTTGRMPVAMAIDCGEGDGSRHPGGTEVCDGLDGDCDGMLDEGVTRTFYRDTDADAFGVMAMTTAACFRPAGYADVAGDCDDTRSDIRPGAPEVCDAAMRDENCDMVSNPPSLCMCSDGATMPCATPGVCAAGIQTCTGGRFGACSISPTMESCNGLDDDCDGTVDDAAGGGTLTVTCFEDEDDDGYAATGATMAALCPVTGRSAVMGCPFGTTHRAPLGAAIDCDDASDVRHPGATEICNGASEDCDAANDEGLPLLSRYRDTDGDGREGTIVMACEGAPGTSGTRNDCDETSPRRLSIYVGAPELCDGWDDNCDGSGGIGPGLRDPNEDRDMDGYMPIGFALCSGGTLLPGDCNDDPLAGGATDHPSAVDRCDARDNDCDGLADEEPDSDTSCGALAGGYAGCSAGTCVLVGCQPGRGDCDGSGGTGCEEILSSSAAHCGGCGVECGAGGACLGGVCDGVVELAAMSQGTCWRYASGRIGCFGADVGEPMMESLVPLPVPGITTATQMATFHQHGCAVLTGGTVACWGRNGDGQLGVDPRGPIGGRSWTAQVVAGITGAVEVDVGNAFSCARITSGSVRCWGDNLLGQLGDGTTTDRHTPAPVMLPAGWTALDLEVGAEHACVAADNGGMRAVWCWGANASGQLGNGTMLVAQTTPVQTSLLTSVAALAAGDAFTCAINTVGGLYCWGEGDDGRIGNGSAPSDQGSPQFLTIASPTLLVAGHRHACAVQSGNPRCWGDNTYGQLGNRTVVDQHLPVAMMGATGVTAIWASDHTCVRMSTGRYACTGLNASGQLGDGTTTNAMAAGEMVGVSSMAESATGNAFSCARRTTGELACWGDDMAGQLGIGMVGPPFGTPQPLALTGVAEVVAAGASACARMLDGTLRCWGSNRAGSLGDGTMTDRSSPVSVTGVTGAFDLDVGERHACAVVTGGGVRCWGENNEGQLGDGTTTRRLTAVPAVISSVTSIAVGASSSCATTQSGQLLCWGSNSSGQLGVGDLVARSAPTPAIGMTDVLEVEVESHACARRAGGQVWCWGANGEGQVGDGTRTVRTSPVRVILPLPAVAIALGPSNSCALLEDANVWCWGEGSSGQIGDGSTADRLTPRQVMGGIAFASVSVGGSHACASRGSEGVSCWGNNSLMQIGDGTTVMQLTPAPVTGLP